MEYQKKKKCNLTCIGDAFLKLAACALIWFLNLSSYADSAEIFSHPVYKLFWWSEVCRISLRLRNCPETITCCYATIPPSDGTQKIERCRVCYVCLSLGDMRVTFFFSAGLVKPLKEGWDNCCHSVPHAFHLVFRGSFRFQVW